MKTLSFMEDCELNISPDSTQLCQFQIENGNNSDVCPHLFVPRDLCSWWGRSTLGLFHVVFALLEPESVTYWSPCKLGKDIENCYLTQLSESG